MLKKIMVISISFFIFKSIFVIASEINLPRSGQTTSYSSGDDGAVTAGQPSPAPRFIAVNGTATDNLTGLVWLQNANCTETVGGVVKVSGYLPWGNALTWSNSLASGKCGLTDGSTAGSWRLPTRKEMKTLIDLSNYNPSLPAVHLFSNLQSNYYWSSTTYAGSTTLAWLISLVDGLVDTDSKTAGHYVWPVRYVLP